MRTKVNTDNFKTKINKGAYTIAKHAAEMIEKRAKQNMDPLYSSNYRWSLIHPYWLSGERSGLARASIHAWWNRKEYWVRIGSTADVMKKGVEGIAGSSVNYFPYLEFGTWAIPPLGMLRSAFDEVKKEFR